MDGHVVNPNGAFNAEDYGAIPLDAAAPAADAAAAAPQQERPELDSPPPSSAHQVYSEPAVSNWDSLKGWWNGLPKWKQTLYGSIGVFSVVGGGGSAGYALFRVIAG